MAVEFIGILVFSMLMSFVNNLFVGGDNDDTKDSSSDLVDQWLVKLDNSRTSKNLPDVLYEKIKVYISESILYDHKKILTGFEFLQQLKP